MQQFDGHFRVLSSAATGSTPVMEALAMTTTTQYKKILAAMDYLKTLSIAAAAMNSGGNRDSATVRLTPNKRTKSNIRINQLILAIKGKWVPGRFCSTQGHGMGAGHSRKIATTKPGRARRAATITMPRALILLVLVKTGTNIGIKFCCDRGGALTIV